MIRHETAGGSDCHALTSPVPYTATPGAPGQAHWRTATISIAKAASMLHPETHEAYRRMTPSERLQLTILRNRIEITSRKPLDTNPKRQRGDSFPIADTPRSRFGLVFIQGSYFGPVPWNTGTGRPEV